jgi:hypothetical protein
MGEDESIGRVALRLSTGYEVEVDLDKISTLHWRGHLARAILGERVLEEAKHQQDRATPAWHFDAIPEEIRYILATTPPALKDALLYQLFFEEIVKLAKRLDRKFAKRLE